MSRLYVAGDNIPAGHYVTNPDPRSDVVYGVDPFKSQHGPGIKIMIGIARENLREGFRVVERENGFYEDDA